MTPCEHRSIDNLMMNSAIMYSNGKLIAPTDESLSKLEPFLNAESFRFHNMEVHKCFSKFSNDWQSTPNETLENSEENQFNECDKMFQRTFSRSDIDSLSGTESSTSCKPRQPKKAVKWEETELVYLVFLVEKLGTAWGKISTTYKKYFINRNARDLKKKYYTLKTNHKSLMDGLKEQANLINENEVLVEQTIEKKMYIRWDEEEILYLGKLHG